MASKYNPAGAFGYLEESVRLFLAKDPFGVGNVAAQSTKVDALRKDLKHAQRMFENNEAGKQNDGSLNGC